MADIQRSETALRGFSDPEMGFQFLRGLGVIGSGGGALGEMLAAARGIPDGDVVAWVDRFEALAAMLLAEADRVSGRAVSASDLRLRASMYLRAAEYFEPIGSERHGRLGRASRDAFTRALPALPWPAEAIRIPCDGQDMPGYVFLAADDGVRRPAIIINGGFDSSGEELYFQFGLDALRRGINVVVFDGPGQTGMQRDGATVFRPDWETVVGAVVDAVLARPEMDGSRLGLLGISFGGYFAMRALARETRLAAACLNSPVTDLHAYVMAFVPPEFRDEFLATPRREVEDPDSETSRETPRPMRANLLQLFHRFRPDAETCGDMVARLEAFRLQPADIGRIGIPVLAAVGEGEGALPRAQCDAFAEAAGGPVDTVVFTRDWGADSHCQVTNVQRLGQVTHDWFAERFRI